jgi:7-cyano-7-deazaguanine synthase
MCAIVGRWTGAMGKHDMATLLWGAVERGRDSWGVCTDVMDLRKVGPYQPGTPVTVQGRWALGNTRAEPTTEYVVDKLAHRDVQPFRSGPLVVAHNGTIANDRELQPAGYDAKARSQVDTARWAAAAALEPTVEGVLGLLGRTIGSYGIAVAHRTEGWVVLATNYKPLYVRRDGDAWEWSSINPTGHPFLHQLAAGWQPLPAYSALVLRPGQQPEWVDMSVAPADSALVVCSGGLDSTVVAAWAARRYDRVDLLHITYGCRAQANELLAVRDIADALKLGLRTLDLTDVFAAIGNSRLTGTWEGVADGEAGAEFAHEWVPARNLIMLAAAVGIAEGHGYGHVMLGNNLEEAGAYPDNEQEFIARLNTVMPYAVGAGRKVQLLEPVGHLVKHEIVQLGLAEGAPLDLTWSCYDAGERHCGSCGPCYMRKAAFHMAGEPDPMQYEAA